MPGPERKWIAARIAFGVLGFTGLLTAIGCNGEHRSTEPEAEPIRQADPLIPPGNSNARANLPGQNNIEPSTGISSPKPENSADKRFLSEGDEVPDYVLYDLDGKEVNLGSYLGEGPVVLGIFMIGPPVTQGAPKVIEEIGPGLQGDNIGFLNVAVSSFSGDVRQYVEENGSYGTVLMDFSPTSELARMLGVDNIPGYVIIDRDGRIARVIDSPIAKKQLSDTIQQVIAQ